MVNPGKRSSTILKKYVRTPGNKTVERYDRKVRTHANCTMCKKKLQGVQTDKTSKTAKKAGRKYSGQICHTCTQQIIKLQARISAGQIKITDTDMKYRKYLKE